MQIKNHTLENVPFKRSPNVGGQIMPSYIVVHYDAAPNATSAINWMVNPSSKVSAHLHIDRAGNVVQLVEFNKKAWHAGKSSWRGLTDLNNYSIGIELQNTGTQEYTHLQLQALARVCKALVKSYSINEIVGHSDIAPGRKIDPGPQFPMTWLRNEVFNSALNSGAEATKETAADLHLRKGAGTNHASITVLPKGTEVDVLSVHGDWSEVFVCQFKIKGFVSSKYIK